ncbi:MAG: DNA-deoxyinosine glycosylase, partial [Bacteroidales bacterium]|nr:DNA-deoxyinosine glycosylase [Bacteroidales bacterium]
RIALWDVVRAAERKGSADTDIRREEPNDIPGLLRRCPTIHTVAFNGKAAARLFQKHFPQLELPATRQIRFLVRLSTSPANCQFREEEMYENWREVIER